MIPCSARPSCATHVDGQHRDRANGAGSRRSSARRYAAHSSSRCSNRPPAMPRAPPWRRGRRGRPPRRRPAARRCAGTPAAAAALAIPSRCPCRSAVVTRPRRPARERRRASARTRERLLPRPPPSRRSGVRIEHGHAVRRRPRARRASTCPPPAARPRRRARPPDSAARPGPPPPPQPRHAAAGRERAPARPLAARAGHAAQQLARRHRLRPARERRRPAVRRQVVVVALEPRAPQPQPRRERVQLLELPVRGHVAPRRERERDAGVLAQLVDQDRHGEPRSLPWRRLRRRPGAGAREQVDHRAELVREQLRPLDLAAVPRQRVAAVELEQADVAAAEHERDHEHRLEARPARAARPRRGPRPGRPRRPGPAVRVRSTYSVAG